MAVLKITRYTIRRKLGSLAAKVSAIAVTKEQAEVYLRAEYPSALPHWHDIHNEDLATYYRKDCLRLLSSKTNDRFIITVREVDDEPNNDVAAAP